MKNYNEWLITEHEEQFEDVLVVTYDEYIKNDYDFNKVVDFYNEMFPKSYHSADFKRDKYSANGSKVLIAIDLETDNVVGILESWISKGVRILATAVVYKEYQGRGLLKQMFKAFIKECNENIVLHFRDSNKEKLEQVYKNLGFKDLENVGEYMNGEIKWEMTYYV